MYPKAIFFGCLLGLSLASCAGHSNTTVLPPEEPRTFAPGSHSYIASRSFHVRTTPKLSGAVVEKIDEGTEVNAVIVFHDSTWNYVRLNNGSEGYVFGMPLMPLRQNHYLITD